ncbi:WG repeat-containing protein [Marinicrinis lubricantis]|uniref:WG repeat-containing protein n=1 Tax=Marinicrinis lubricantis TaxID=2086470 RepID=A0ABW1IRD2_9BACL
MKWTVNLLLCMILCFSAVSAAQAEEEDRFVIDPQYIDVLHYNYTSNTFNEGLAWVQLTASGDMGVIDRAGNLQFDGYDLDPYSHTSYVYSEGLSRVIIDNHWAYIDRQGHVVLETAYDTVLNFREGLAAVSKNGKWGFIDRTGKLVIPLQFDEVRDDDGYGISAGTSGFYEGLAAVLKNGKWGFIDHSGKFVIQPKYEWVGNFSDGLASVTDGDKYGYIDKAGREVVPLKYTETLRFSEGIGVVIIPNNNYYHFAFINKQGRIVADFKNLYSFVYPLEDGVSIAKYHRGDPTERYVLLDKTGKVIADLGDRYAEIRSFREGLAYVYMQNHKMGMIDRSGKEVVEPIYESLKSSSDGLIAASLERDSFGFILNPLDTPSGWAKSEVKAASALGVIPVDIEYGYQNDITRADFSKLALQLFSVKMNKSVDELLQEAGKTIQGMEITDTYDETVLAAHALGIINGTGPHKLNPNGFITRQEAAVMLTRVANMLHIPAGGKSLFFTDEALMGSWAKQGIGFISTIKDGTNDAAVMSGVGANNLGRKRRIRRSRRSLR